MYVPSRVQEATAWHFVGDRQTMIKTLINALWPHYANAMTQFLFFLFFFFTLSFVNQFRVQHDSPSVQRKRVPRVRPNTSTGWRSAECCVPVVRPYDSRVGPQRPILVSSFVETSHSNFNLKRKPQSGLRMQRAAVTIAQSTAGLRRCFVRLPSAHARLSGGVKSSKFAVVW